LNSFFHIDSFARRAAAAMSSRIGACWRSHVRITALVLIAILFANSAGLDSAAQSTPRPRPQDQLGIKAKGALVTTALVATVAGIGVGAYVLIQQAHTVKGCVSEDPDGLLLHTKDGKVYVLLGATTNIKADTTIKVRGTRRKKIDGLTDRPTFVVEKVNKVYGPCSINPVNP
jgi:hypothetical protein